jgi:hypothetical protein
VTRCGEALRLLLVLRFAVARPWAIGSLCLFFGVLAGANELRAGLWAGLALSYVCLVQGLRVTWRGPRQNALAIGGVVLVAAAMLILEGDPGARSRGLALLATLPLAVALEAVIRKQRALRGPLWLDAPAPSPAEVAKAAQAAAAPRGFWARNRSGCAGALLLGLGFCGWSFYKISEPGRHAADTRAALRPGQSVREIVAAARGGFMCTIVVPNDAGAEPERLYRIVSWRGDRYELGEGPGSSLGTPVAREEMLRWLDARDAELARARRVHLSFLALGVPPRVAFIVELDEHGRLKEISPSRTWD